MRFRKLLYSSLTHICSQCEKKFDNKTKLYYHKQYVHEGVRHPCNKCHSQFNRKSNLKEHIQTIHEGVKRSVYRALRQKEEVMV